MIANISNYYFEEAAYVNSAILTQENVYEQIENGNHLAVIDYLKAGGKLWDPEEHLYYEGGPFDYFLWHLFTYLNPAQRNEIFSTLSDLSQLPPNIDSLFITEQFNETDETEQKMVWFEELLPHFERLHYPFNDCFAKAMSVPDLKWIEFFLTHPILGLNLNEPISISYRWMLPTKIDTLNTEIKVHPYTALQLKLVDLIERFTFHRSDSYYKNIHELIRQMENHPGVDLKAAQDECAQLREIFYFEEDLQKERDYILLIEAKTLDGLEKQIAAGFNIYEPVGPFISHLFGRKCSDILWIELLCGAYNYNEATLVNLMEKHANPSND